MSFVSITATTDFISIMSDGLVMNGDLAVHERMKKYTVIDNRAFIAYTGVLENITFILNLLPLTHYDFERWTHEICALIKNNLSSMPFPDGQCFFAIGGISDKNRVEYFAFGTHIETKPRPYLPIEGNPRTTFLNGVVAASLPLSGKYNEYLNKTPKISVNDYVYAQKMLNDYVATFDPTVNNQIHNAVIEKALFI